MSLVNASSLGIPSSLTFLGGSLSSLTGHIASHPVTAPTASFDAIYAFGDSLSDAGNVYIATGKQSPVSPPYFQGHFTNGFTWVEDLAVSHGLGPLAPSLLSAQGSNSTDFAFGRAETGTTPLHVADDGDLPSQLMQFEEAYPTPQTNALYTLSIGSVDLFDAISVFPSAPLTALANIGIAVLNVDNFILQLAAHDGKNFLVLTAPDIGKAPAYESEGPVAFVTASALSAVFNSALTTSLQAIAAENHLNLSIVDTYSLVDKGVAHPELFNLTNVTDPVWTGNYTDPNSGTLRATTQAAQSQYLFWDQVHPTAAGHIILASAAETSLLHVA